MAEFVQVNVNVTDEDARMLDRMMVEDAYDNRSAWVRRLIRQEWARRYSKPNPLISVADAMLARKEIGVADSGIKTLKIEQEENHEA